ncbi:MAG: lipoyl(octanoyl) transferase LipB [Desulfobacterium sp.]|jgi:lipoyl(octanoyl) transferase|nr:lipoyl(octanoyl) transferase LipB [Desulfobacterium sp.]
MPGTSINAAARTDMPLPKRWIADLKIMDYQEAYDLQQQISEAKTRRLFDPDVILILEHLPVFTLGKRGGSENLKVDDSFLQARGIPIIPTRRGGNITYHGPGQVIVYPIVDLARARMGVAGFVNLLEETMIMTCRAFDINAGRNPKNHGIWVGQNKIGSIGLSVKHGVCHHGLALNVNLDMEPFTWINPCGLAGVSMTSMAQELENKNQVTPPDMVDTVRQTLVKSLGRATGFKLEPAQIKQLLAVSS